MDREQKIDDMHALIHEMNPKLDFCVEGLKTQELRLRFLENQNLRNDLRIDRHDKDLSRMGGNIREVEGRVKLLEDKRRVREAAGAEENHNRKWVAVLEFLAVVPQYWRWIVSGIFFLLTIAGFILRHIHMGVHR